MSRRISERFCFVWVVWFDGLIEGFSGESFMGGLVQLRLVCGGNYVGLWDLIE